MGFGIVTIGFLSMLLVDFGGSVIAGVVCAYGLYLASRLGKRFTYAALTALLMIPNGVLILINLVAGIEVSETLLTSFGTLMYLAWGGMMLFFLTAVREITSENGAKGFTAETDAFLYVNLLFVAFEIGGAFLPLRELAVVLAVIKYIIAIANTLFAHKCFTLISTERATKKELSEIEQADKKAAERKAKRDKRNKEISEGRKKGK